MRFRLQAAIMGGWALAVAVQCGGEPPGLHVAQRTSARIVGRFSAEQGEVGFRAEGSAPLAGDVAISVGSVLYALHYDYEARHIVANGHGGAIDRASHQALRDAVEGVFAYLHDSARQGGELPLQEQMLYAALSLLQESGGTPLPRVVFQVDAPRVGSTRVDKSLDNDGVTCITRGSTHAVSFDDLSGSTLDLAVTAGVADCNGQCGPGCTRLTPWSMWTLDCLEHDTCCELTGDGSCWVPLGQCGDEYLHAQADFLRGFDPLRGHCDG